MPKFPGLSGTNIVRALEKLGFSVVRQTGSHMRITQLKANVERQREVLQRERDNQKRQRAAERARANLGGV